MRWIIMYWPFGRKIMQAAIITRLFAAPMAGISGADRVHDDPDRSDVPRGVIAPTRGPASAPLHFIADPGPLHPFLITLHHLCYSKPTRGILPPRSLRRTIHLAHIITSLTFLKRLLYSSTLCRPFHLPFGVPLPPVSFRSLLVIL